MKRLLMALAAGLILAAAALHAQSIKSGERFFDGQRLWSAEVLKNGYVRLSGTDGLASNDAILLEPIAGEPTLYFLRQEHEGGIPPFHCNWGDNACIIREDGMNFIVISDSESHTAEILVLTPDSISDLRAQQQFAAEQDLEDLCTDLLFNSDLLSNLSDPELDELDKVFGRMSDMELISFWNSSLVSGIRWFRANDAQPPLNPEGLGSDGRGGDEMPEYIFDYPPMFIYQVSPEKLEVAYTAYPAEPQKYEEEEDDSYFYENHFQWAREQYFRSHARGYDTVLRPDFGTAGVRCDGELLRDPDGHDLDLYGLLRFRPENPMPGMLYSYRSKADVPPGNFDDFFLLTTSDWLSGHKVLDIEPQNTDDYDDYPEISPKVIADLEEQFDAKTTRSMHVCKIDGKWNYGVTQFEPQDGVLWGSEVFWTDDGTICTYTREGNYDPDDEFFSAWNVDDGGIYFHSRIIAAFEDEDGFMECYYVRYAPESCEIGVMYIADGEMDRITYGYYQISSEESYPLWEKDVRKMRELYLTEDPHAHKDIFLSRYAQIDIDQDGIPEIWLQDAEGKNGAFFTNRDGEISLLLDASDSRKPVYLMDEYDEHAFLRIGRPGGGPAWFTEIAEIKDSRLVHKATILEVYGEIDECTMDGKTIDKAEGKKFSDKAASFREKEPWYFFRDLDY